MTGCCVNWRGFVRALADEIDGVGGAAARDALLRGVGRRMAASHPLAGAPDIAGLELEVNDHLSGWGWGRASLRLVTEERALMITHHGLPHVGAAGDPPGTWLSAVLEGLFDVWMSTLPGADKALVVKRHRVAADVVTLRYARA
jgi:hypothetical protein